MCTLRVERAAWRRAVSFFKVEVGRAVIFSVRCFSQKSTLSRVLMTPAAACSVRETRSSERRNQKEGEGRPTLYVRRGSCRALHQVFLRKKVVYIY